MQETKVIALPLPYGLGSVNSYLIDTDNGFVLIDTGGSSKRAGFELFDRVRRAVYNAWQRITEGRRRNDQRLNGLRRLFLHYVLR